MLWDGLTNKLTRRRREWNKSLLRSEWRGGWRSFLTPPANNKSYLSFLSLSSAKHNLPLYRSTAWPVLKSTSPIVVVSAVALA